MQSGHTPSGMRLGDYVGLLRRQWLPVLLCLILGVGLAFAYAQLAPKEYRSQTSVLVTPTTPDAVTDRSDGINLDTEAQLVTSTETVADAAELLADDGATVTDLADRVNVSVPPNTEILDITFIGDTAQQAQQGARAFAQAYLDQRQSTAEAALQAEFDALQARYDAVQAQLTATLKAGQSLPANSAELARNERQVTLLNDQLANITSAQNRVRSETVTPGRVVTEAPLPRTQSSPDLFIALAAGVLLGLVVGIGLGALRQRADDVIRSPEDLFRRTGVPATSVLSTRLHDGEVTVLQPLSADGRGYARLRNLVSTSLDESNRKVVLVAGVRRGGGPVAANLAASLARAGEEVVLVCADVFGDTAVALLRDAPTSGLAEVLAGEKPVESVVRRLPGIAGLRILGPGVDVDRADALLQTRSPRKLVDRLLESASYVVIEAPPTTDSPDAQTLANVAELAVLVVESGPTRAREVLDACAQLESMGTPVLGAVIASFGRDSDADLRQAAVVSDDETPDLLLADDDTTSAEDDSTEDDGTPAESAADARPGTTAPAVGASAAATVTIPAVPSATSSATAGGQQPPVSQLGSAEHRPAGQPPVPPANQAGAGNPSTLRDGSGVPSGTTNGTVPSNGSNSNGGMARPTDTQLVPPGSRGPAPR